MKKQIKYMSMKKEKSETVDLYRQLPKIEVIIARNVYSYFDVRFCKINGDTCASLSLSTVKGIAIERGFIDSRDFIPCRYGAYKALMLPIRLFHKVLECGTELYSENHPVLGIISATIDYANTHNEELPDNIISETEAEKAKTIWETINAIKSRKRIEKQEEKRKIGENALLRDLVSKIEDMGWNVSLSLKEMV